MTKPVLIALGVGAAATACAGIAIASHGVARFLAAWTALACAVAALAYVANRPHWLGKRRGVTSPRALLVLPYLVAFRIACRMMAWWRGPDHPTRVAPGLWVGGRVRASTLPPGVTTIVDLVAEYGAARAVRRMPGYRCLPVLDGGFPADLEQAAALVRELAAIETGDVLVHCDSGRARAPTFAAAVLIARGLATDAADALTVVCARRRVAAPTRSDVTFLDAVAPRVRPRVAAARDVGAAAVVDQRMPVR
jgi:protein-tyrosine phosphatase